MSAGQKFKCEICSKEFKAITNSHLKRHEITNEEYKCDFYIPKYNLIVEIDGDYWHANPKKYKANDIIGLSKKIAKKIWESDKTKTHDLLNEGYKVLRYWASDLKNITHEKIFEDIVHTFTKVEE